MTLNEITLEELFNLAKTFNTVSIAVLQISARLDELNKVRDMLERQIEITKKELQEACQKGGLPCPISVPQVKDDYTQCREWIIDYLKDHCGYASKKYIGTAWNKHSEIMKRPDLHSLAKMVVKDLEKEGIVEVPDPFRKGCATVFLLEMRKLIVTVN